MSIDIFIRTYPKDFFLLNYCLQSIRKFVTGYRNIIINIRQKNYNELMSNVNTAGCIIVQSHDFDDKIDYCGQQICKIYADIWSDATYFYYVDSDCIFYNNFNIQEKYFDSNKNIVLFKDYWHNIPDTFIWQGCLKKLDLLTEFEFMRRLPQLYPSRFLKPLRIYIEQKIGKDYINSCLTIYKECGFSEFNIMGSYLYLHDPSEMNICFYNPDLNQIPVRQFWSHEKKDVLINEINKLLLS